MIHTWVELLHLARSVDTETLCSEGQLRSINGDALHEVTGALRAALAGTSQELLPQSVGNLIEEPASTVESGATMNVAGTGETLDVPIPMVSPGSGNGAMLPEEEVTNALVPVARQEDEQEPELCVENTQSSWPSIHFCEDDFNEAIAPRWTPQEQPPLPVSGQSTRSSTLHLQGPWLEQTPRVLRTETTWATSTGWSGVDDEATALLKMEDAARRMLQSPESRRSVDGHQVFSRAEVSRCSEAARKKNPTLLLQESTHTMTNKRGCSALLLCSICREEPSVVTPR